MLEIFKMKFKSPTGTILYSIEKAINDGGDLFIEVGPGRVLSNMIEGIDSSIPKLNVEDVQSVEKTVKELTR